MPKQSERMSDEAVRAKTGKSWDEWLTILDAAGARSLGHKEIVAIVGEHGVGPWWRQMVTVTYEQARGMREKYQTASGYTANASRTIGVPVDRLFEAWSDATLRGRWLPDAELTIRKATPDKSLRITWEDGSNVDVGLVSKGDSKSQVAVEHAKLPDAEAVARAKGYWKQALDRLQAMVEG
ncbi:MAG TPA: SRPBCC domain-containing protein [Thermoanaerobaculia bacterium]